MEQLELVVLGRIGTDLLQGEDVGIDRVDDAQDAVGIVAPIHADAGVNVVGGGADKGGLGRGIGDNGAHFGFAD